MAGFVNDAPAFVAAGSEIHSATLRVVLQQMVFVIALAMAKKCVNFENLMPNCCSHGTRRETVRMYRSEWDVATLARLVLRGWLRTPQTLGQVFHHESSETGIPAGSMVST